MSRGTRAHSCQATDSLFFVVCGESLVPSVAEFYLHVVLSFSESPSLMLFCRILGFKLCGRDAALWPFTFKSRRLDSSFAIFLTV